MAEVKDEVFQGEWLPPVTDGVGKGCGTWELQNGCLGELSK